MQIGNRVDSNYGVPYQKQRRGTQDTRFTQTKNTQSMQTEENCEDNSTDGRKVRKPWISMGAKVREQLVEQASSLEEDGYREECMELIQKKIAEMQEKIDSGEDVNESFQIGAKSFTEEEWDKLLEEFDAVQEVIRELMKERQEQMEKQQLKEEMLEENQAVAEMMILFEDKSKYSKVMGFINQFTDDEDLRFTANKDFWEEFFEGKEDVERLKEKYLNSTVSDERETETI